MADYYPLLVRAISSLPQKTGENRRAVYDRARATLVRQLRSVDPPLPEGEITRERLALEESIRRVEAEYAPQDNGPEPEEAAPPPRVPAAIEPRRPPTRPEPEPPPQVEAPERAAPERVAPEEAPSPEMAAPRREPKGRAWSEEADEADEAAEQGSDQRRPSVRRGEVRSRAAANGAKRKPRKAEKGGSWQKLTLWILMACVVLGGIALAVVNRHLIYGNTPPSIAASSDAPKNSDRVAATTGGDSAPRTSAPRTASGGAARAVLLEESPGGGQPQTFEGTVTWKTETVSAGPGLPPDIGVRGEITIPERQISMQFVLRRNNDQTLPASHTIEVSFKLPADFPFGGIGNVPAIGAKQSPQARGNPLAGLSVKVSPTLFLVGLSQAAQDRQRNLALLQLSPWFDVPIVYTNNKRALIAFEKGPEGDQAFNDAFSAWGELIQRPEPGAQGEQQPQPKQNGG